MALSTIASFIYFDDGSCLISRFLIIELEVDILVIDAPGSVKKMMVVANVLVHQDIFLSVLDYVRQAFIPQPPCRKSSSPL